MSPPFSDKNAGYSPEATAANMAPKMMQQNHNNKPMAMHLNMDQVHRANNQMVMNTEEDNSVKLKLDETIGNDSIGAPTVGDEDLVQKQNEKSDEIELNLSSDEQATTNKNPVPQPAESPNISSGQPTKEVNDAKDLRQMLEKQQIGSAGSSGS